MQSPSSSLSSLLCQESSSILLAEDELDGDEEDPSLATLFTSNGFPDSEDEYVQLLLQREKSHFSVLHSQTFNSGNLSKIARLDAIDYILHIVPRMGFQFQTAYLAVTYLDRFLALRTVDSERAWASELLSLGCVSVAAKFQETNVPGLSLFQHGNIRFEIKAIQRMELLILSTLEWKMDSITPFSFLPYFINNLISEAPQAITLNKIVQLILAFMKDRSLIDHYPSAIALSAVLMSLDDNFTRNALYSKINALASNRFLDNDYVSNCYLIMQKLERKQTKILQLSASPDLSPIKSTQMGSFQNSSATYSISSKRRRLFFNGNFDNNEAESDKRQHKLHDI